MKESLVCIGQFCGYPCSMVYSSDPPFCLPLIQVHDTEHFHIDTDQRPDLHTFQCVPHTGKRRAVHGSGSADNSYSAVYHMLHHIKYRHYDVEVIGD